MQYLSKLFLKESIESATTTVSGNDFQALITLLQKENFLKSYWLFSTINLNEILRVRLSRFKVKVGTVFTSYKLLKILCISSKSPRKCRYFKVGNCDYLILSSYDNPLGPRISLIALFWMASISSIKDFKHIQHTQGDF